MVDICEHCEHSSVCRYSDNVIKIFNMTNEMLKEVISFPLALTLKCEYFKAEKQQKNENTTYFHEFLPNIKTIKYENKGNY